MDTTELLKKENGLIKPIKERKKHDRFNGMPEEEVVKRTLPDHLTPNLDIVIVSTNIHLVQLNQDGTRGRLRLELRADSLFASNSRTGTYSIPKANSW